MQDSLFTGNTPVALPFGKYKDKPVEIIRQNDPAYLDWLIGQAWFKEKFPSHYTVIINYGAASDSTPAHNAMQALFLEDHACYQVLAAIRPLLFSSLECCTIERSTQIARAKEYEWKVIDGVRAHLLAGAKRQWQAHDEPTERVAVATPTKLVGSKVQRFPELQGWDWILRISLKCSSCGESPWQLRAEKDPKWDGYLADVRELTLGVELKPTLGDDYPTVIRQIQQHGSTNSYSYVHHRVAIVGRYTGEGASFPQVRKIFAAANILLVLLEEVRNTAV
jgi:hypothetical protein